jgi:hypothetical protein
MAVAHVQVSTEGVVTAGTSGSVTLTGVGSGRLLIAYIHQAAGTLRTYTASDDRSNAWAEAVAIATSFVSSLWYGKNTAAGDTQITIAASLSATYRFFVQEVSGADTTAPLDQTSSQTAEGSTNNHTSSASASVIDTAADVIVCCVGSVSSSGVSATTAGGSYTKITSAVVTFLAQYWVSAGALTNEQGAWSHTGTARAGRSVIASFKGATGGGGNRRRRFFLGAA